MLSAGCSQMGAKVKRARRLFQTLLLSSFVLSVILSQAVSATDVTRNAISSTSIQALPVGASSVQLSDGRFLIVGGMRDQTPLNRLALYDPATQQTSILSVTLLHARYRQSASILPDGRVLIFGGIGTDGSIVSDAEWFDPITHSVQSAGDLGLTPRAGHTTTVLTDGNVLFVGGVDTRGVSIDRAELWNPRTSQLITSIISGNDRNGASAQLLADGNILITGGKDSQGRVVDNGIEFITEKLYFTTVDASALQAIDKAAANVALSVVAQLPPVDSAGFAPDGIISLRFSRPVDPTSINAQTVTLIGPNGPTLVRIAVNDRGMLAFITPNQMLEPGSLYSVFINGAKDATAGQPMTLLAWTFKTATLGGNSQTTSDSKTDVSSTTNNETTAANQQDFSQATVQKQPVTTPPSNNSITATDDEMWIPSPQDYKGEWRSNRADLAKNYPPLRIETQRAFLRHELDRDGRLRERDIEARLPAVTQPAAPAGVTSVTGQILRLNGKPLAGVTLSMGSQQTISDNNGEFLLTNVPSGENQLLSIDGQTANNSNSQYGRYDYLMHIAAGKVTAMPVPIWLAKLDTAHAVKIPSPTTQAIVVTNPLLPGFELHIPAGTVIRDVNGKIVTQISITPVPSDQLPFPMPYGDLPLYYTIQPGGAVLQSVTGQPQGASLVYPNYSTQPPGARFQLFGFDPRGRGWYTYGMATVSADDKHIVSDKGFTIYQFTATSAASSGGTPPTTGPQNCSDVNCSCPVGGIDGDPVSCHEGLFMETHTDLALRDIVPLTLTRTYRNQDANQRSFGIGATQQYDLYLYFPTAGYNETEIDLILPSGGRIPFNVVGTDTNYTHAAALYQSLVPGEFYQAKLQISANGYGHDFYVTLKNGTRYDFSYYNSRLKWIDDRNGNRIAIIRDSSNRISQVISPEGRYVSFQYAAATCNTCVSQATDNTGRIVSYAYNSVGALAQVTDAASGTTQYAYDSAYNMTTLVDPRLNTQVSNQYYTSQDGANLNGRVKLQTYADASTNSFAYAFDTNGNVIQTNITHALGDIRSIQYNSAGFITQETQALGTSQQQVTVNNWDLSTRLLTSTIDPLNRTTAYTYDAHGNVATITKLAGTANAVSWNYTYEPIYNQVASVTDPLNHTVNFTYDSLGNLVSVSDALNHVNNFTYNSAGQVLRLTDPLGNSSQITYNFGDLNTVTDPLGHTTGFFTDGAGREAARTDPLNNRSVFAYDAFGNLAQITDALGGITTFSYDPNSNFTSITDAKGGVNIYGYDKLNRLTSRTDPLFNTESQRYDGNGNLVQYTDRKGQVVTLSYDSLNRVIQTTYADGSTASYSYDAGNRVIQVVDSISGTITRSYDGLNHLVSETSPRGTISYTYDTAGNRASMTVEGQPTVNYGYDANHQLIQISQGAAVVSLTYDAAGRRTSLTLPNGIIVSYSYDAASELTGISYQQGATVIGNLIYGYDADGRRISMDGSLAKTGLPMAISATYNAANQLVQWGTSPLTYDANGNLLGDGANSYTWNARNQLTGISGGASASFQYDAFGRRGSKTVNANTTGFLYDGINTVQELNGMSISANLLTGLNADEIYTRTNGAGTSNYLTDALGSTIALTDTSGVIQTQYSYEPYGNATVMGAPSDNAYQYTGRENDNTGLYYYRARYYHPVLQRFISEDPIGLAGGDVDFYSYVQGSPLLRVDPLGLYDLTFSTGLHVPISPGVAVGPVASSSIQNYSQNPNGPLTANPVNTDVALGVIADAGVNVGISDISGTGGKCAGTTINLGAGRYAGAQITFRQSQDQSLSIFNPARYIDGISIGLGIGIATPVSASRGF